MIRKWISLIKIHGSPLFISLVSGPPISHVSEPVCSRVLAGKFRLFVAQYHGREQLITRLQREARCSLRWAPPAAAPPPPHTGFRKFAN